MRNVNHLYIAHKANLDKMCVHVVSQQKEVTTCSHVLVLHKWRGVIVVFVVVVLASCFFHLFDKTIPLISCCWCCCWTWGKVRTKHTLSHKSTHRMTYAHTFLSPSLFSLSLLYSLPLSYIPITGSPLFL